MEVFCVMRNADFTEGRGPMRLDRIFLNRDDAVDYMDSQPGVMGRRAKWSEEKVGGDWRLEPKIVHEGKWAKEEADKEETRKLLNRLSPRERELLASHFYLNQ